MDEVNQQVNPFSTPPPEPTLMQQFQKKNYELMENMNNNLIAMKNKTIEDLNKQVFHLSAQNFELSALVKKFKSGKKESHKTCDDDYKKLGEELDHIEGENETLKNELFKCKFKEKHKRGSQDKNRKKDYDKKCVELQVQNIKLKEDIEMLSSSNVERFEQIKSLEKEILELKENGDTRQTPRSFINDSRLQHKCEFCDNAFISMTVLKKTHY